MLKINDVIQKKDKKLFINDREVISNTGKGRNGATSKLPDMIDLTLLYLEEDEVFKQFYLSLLKDMNDTEIPFHTRNGSPALLFEFAKQVIDNFDNDKAMKVILDNKIKINVDNAKYLVKSDDDTLAKTYLTEDMEHLLPFIIMVKLLWMVVLLYVSYAELPINTPLALDKFIANIARKLSLYAPLADSIAYQRLVRYVRSHIKDQGGTNALRYRAEIYSCTTDDVIDLFVPATAFNAIFKSTIPVEEDAGNNTLSSILEECKKSNDRYHAPVISSGDESSGWTDTYSVSTSARVGDSAYIDIDLSCPKKIFDKLSSFNGRQPTKEDYDNVDKLSELVISHDTVMHNYMQTEFIRKCIVLITRADAIGLASKESISNFTKATYYWLYVNGIKNIGEFIVGVETQLSEDDVISTESQLDKISRENDTRLTEITKLSKNKDSIKQAINTIKMSTFLSMRTIVNDNGKFKVDNMRESSSFKNDIVDFLIFIEDALKERNNQLNKLLELDSCFGR